MKYLIISLLILTSSCTKDKFVGQWCYVDSPSDSLDNLTHFNISKDGDGYMVTQGNLKGHVSYKKDYGQGHLDGGFYYHKIEDIEWLTAPNGDILKRCLK
jgi:hypothetical protein